MNIIKLANGIASLVENANDKFALSKEEYNHPKEDRVFNTLENLSWDKYRNILSFNFVENKIKSVQGRSFQEQGVKYVFYKDKLYKKNLISFNDCIDKPYFANVQLEQMKIPFNFKEEILKEIDEKPNWFNKAEKINMIDELIQQSLDGFRILEEEFAEIYVAPNFKEQDKSFWLRVISVPFTFGLSFIGYTTKEQCALNKQKNEEIDKENELNYDKLEKEITQFNEENQIILDKLAGERQKVVNKTLLDFIPKDNDNWQDIIQASYSDFDGLQGRYGVYVIKNETNGKYYVGQAKDLQKRLKQHFKDGVAIKQELIDDFRAGNHFVFRYEFVNTKDELDNLEKELIGQYHAFESGYNKTGGNN